MTVTEREGAKLKATCEREVLIHYKLSSPKCVKPRSKKSEFWSRRVRQASLLFIVCALLLPQVHAQDGGLRRQAYLGAALSLPSVGEPGAEVTAMTERTAAASAGLRVGDRIMRINGQLLDNLVAFERAWHALRGGDKIRIEVLRGGETFEREITLSALPKEEFQGIITLYDSVLTPMGYRVRSIVTRPADAKERLPGIFLAPWISCDDSVEAPVGEKLAFHSFLHDLVTRSGHAIMRVERPGWGDSEGPSCSEVDFNTELAAFRAGFQAFRKYDFVDPDRIFILGQSNGAGFAPLVPQGAKVAGYIVTGGWIKTWFEHVLGYERRRRAAQGRSPEEVSEQMKQASEFYSDYLIGKMTPGDVARRKPHLANFWTGLPEHQAGRPAAYFQQLQELNLAAAWAKVDAPTLVFWGEFDFGTSREDHEMMAALINRNRADVARFVVVPRMNHSLAVNESLEEAVRMAPRGRYDGSAAQLALDWLRETSAITPRSMRQLVDAKVELTKANYSGDLDELKRVIADFGRLAQGDPMGWLASYYAGYGSFVLALMVGPQGLLSPEGDPQQMQQLVDEAIQYLEASVEKKQDFADALALLAHCYSMKLRSNPQQYAAVLGPRARERLSAALVLEPRNPRAVLIDAMRIFWTPPQGGGDRGKGLARWQEALELFAKEKETKRDPALPDWGYAEAWAWYAGANLTLALQPPRVVRAKEAADKALALRPDFLWIKKSLLPRIQAQLKSSP